MRLFFFCIGIHTIGGMLVFLLVKPSVEIFFALTISALYTSIPLIFFKFHPQSTTTKAGSREILFWLAIAAPIAILLLDRIYSGFILDINPVAMRDQMHTRQMLGENSTNFSVLGNLLQLPAYYYIFSYFLHERRSIPKTIAATLFFAFVIWLAGSRAFLLVLLLVFWGFRGFPTPRLKQMLMLALVLLAFTAIFTLRAARSEIFLENYLFNITNHLRLPLDETGSRLIQSPLGPIFLSLAYMLHSIVILSEIIFGDANQGFAFAPLIHLFDKIFGMSNSGYQYEGLFTTSAGLVLHDLGWPFLVLAMLLKCIVFRYCSRHRTSNFLSAASTLLAVDSLMGIWTSFANIFLAIPLSFGILAATFVRLKRKQAPIQSASVHAIPANAMKAPVARKVLQKRRRSD